MNHDPLTYRDVLSLDCLMGYQLTQYERTMCHQLQLGVCEEIVMPTHRVQMMAGLVVEYRWEAPKMKYKPDRTIELTDYKKGIHRVPIEWYKHEILEKALLIFK